MLESLINFTVENFVFTVSSLGIILFAFFAINSNNVLNSIISFLISVLFLASIITMLSNAIFGIMTVIIYVSVCSLFLIINKFIMLPSIQHDKDKFLQIVSLIVAIVIFVIAYRFDIYFTKRKALEFYCGTTGITLVISFLFIVVISGISFLLSTKENK